MSTEQNRSINFGVDFSTMGETACELSATVFDCYIDILERADIQGDTEDEIRGAEAGLQKAIRLARDLADELRQAAEGNTES